MDDARGAALLAQIYDQPDDLAARRVYADWLQERGDVRAEVIARQSRPKMRPRDRERVRVLVAQHWRNWVGPAAALIAEEPRFERGFLSRARLAISDPALARDPVFSTLIELTCDRADLVVRPQQRLLRAIHGVTLPALAALAELPFTLPIEHLEIDARGGSPEIEARIAGARAPLFASLRQCSVRLVDDRIRWVLESWIVERVRWLQLRDQPVALQPCMDAMRGHRTLRIDGLVAPASLFTLKYWDTSSLPVLEVDDGEALAVLDTIDGSGFALTVKCRTEDWQLRRDRLRARFPSFEEVDVSLPPSDAYEGGL